MFILKIIISIFLHIRALFYQYRYILLDLYIDETIKITSNSQLNTHFSKMYVYIVVAVIL